MKDKKPLTLTDLARERPANSRAVSARDVATKPSIAAKGNAKSSARINQITVRAASQPPKPKPHDVYAVQNELDEEGDEQGQQAIAPLSASSGHAKSMIQMRSQTAPNGLKRSATLRTGPPAALDASSSKRPLNTEPSFANEKDNGKSLSGRHPRGDDTNPQSVDGQLGRRLYGEMIESEEVEALCFRLGMTPKEIWRIRKEFNDEDFDHTNTITVTSFFYLIHEEKRALTKSILRLAGLLSPSETRIPFDGFLKCIVTFASFTEPELFQFFFQVYTDHTETKSKMGKAAISSMVESDLIKLGQDLQVLRTAFAGNIQIATSTTTGSSQSTTNPGASSDQAKNWTFADFEKFSRLHMVAFFPLIQIQRNVRTVGGLDELYWRQKTREKLLVQQVLLYMKQNHGFLRPLPLKDRVWSFLLQRPTTGMRVRQLAKKLYTG